MRQGFLHHQHHSWLIFLSFSGGKAHNHTQATKQDGVNHSERKEMEDGRWWEQIKEESAGRNVIIGQCEPEDEGEPREDSDTGNKSM